MPARERAACPTTWGQKQIPRKNREPRRLGVPSAVLQSDLPISIPSNSGELERQLESMAGNASATKGPTLTGCLIRVVGNLKRMKYSAEPEEKGLATGRFGKRPQWVLTEAQAR